MALSRNDVVDDDDNCKRGTVSVILGQKLNFKSEISVVVKTEVLLNW